MRFIRARNYTRVTGARRNIDVIVVHDMEYPERPDGAEWCANYFAGRNAPRASAHYMVDNNSVVQGVPDEDVAWAAPGNNHNGIQIEHAGYASQSRSEWLDAYSKAELEISAKLVARLCNRYGIPIRFLSANDLRRGRRGITGHIQVSQAWRRSNHTDPGPNFPWEHYLNRIRVHAKPPKPAPRAGYYTWLRWYLGHKEFKGHARDPRLRPNVPRRIPDKWWRRLRIRLSRK